MQLMDWATLVVMVSLGGRRVRHMRDEEAARFQCGTVLSGRYLMQRLLGKGGFSEVYQASWPSRSQCMQQGQQIIKC